MFPSATFALGASAVALIAAVHEHAGHTWLEIWSAVLLLSAILVVGLYRTEP
jgi:hypothetical protein